MTRSQFFDHKQVYPVFKTTRELTLKNWQWLAGSAPADEQTHTIPAGTEITINSYSANDESYSKGSSTTRMVFKGMPRAINRFFYIPYDAMEFVEYRKGGN